jgi:hypothetical protein
MQNMKGRKMRFRHRELETKSVSELKNVMRMLGISTEGCIEKNELIVKLESSPKVELVKTSTAQQIYTLSELLGMQKDALRRLMQGLGVRVANAEEKSKIDLIRALANSGRVIVSTQGASADEVAELQRQLSSTGANVPPELAREEHMEREPKLQRTQAKAVPVTQYSREELQAMRVTQLKQLLASKGLSTEGLVEKSELINKLLE